MNKIKLYNRYREEIWLEEIEGGVWKLISKNPEALKHMRLILEDDGSIWAVDPSGGPFLGIGGIIQDNLRINSIEEINQEILIKTVKI